MLLSFKTKHFPRVVGNLNFEGLDHRYHQMANRIAPRKSTARSTSNALVPRKMRETAGTRTWCRVWTFFGFLHGVGPFSLRQMKLAARPSVPSCAPANCKRLGATPEPIFNCFPSLSCLLFSIYFYCTGHCIVCTQRGSHTRSQLADPPAPSPPPPPPPLPPVRTVPSPADQPRGPSRRGLYLCFASGHVQSFLELR